MSETTNTEMNFIDQFIATVWAAIPEETANTIAGVKRDFLTGLRSTVDSMIDHEINCLNRHLENARRMREEARRPPTEAAAEA